MGRLAPQIASLITEIKPDIITAQEVFSADSKIVFPDRSMNILQEMQVASALPHTYFSPIHGFSVDDRYVEMGNAILSKFPMVSSETIFTNGEQEKHVNDTAHRHIENTRNAQFVQLQVSEGQLLNVLNHHAHWEPTPEGSQLSADRIQIVIDKIRKLNGPTVFGGDFNVNPGTQVMRLFDGLLEDLTATQNIPSTLSVLGKVPNVACDHILVNGDIKVSSFAASEQLVSDHKPLILEFEL
jgi:endonuclease/exonuclease/phosphatase family metal-dependent hydrolase